MAAAAGASGPSLAGASGPSLMQARPQSDPPPPRAPRAPPLPPARHASRAALPPRARLALGLGRSGAGCHALDSQGN